MSVETASPEQDHKIDFSRRANLSELMDEPCAYEELRDCLHDLEQLNRVTFGYRPTLVWLEQFVLRTRSEPLHIVDVGCGGGDMLRQIRRWAEHKRIPVRLTGIDLNPYAIRAAREFTAARSGIGWISGSAFSFDTAADPIDVVISSLFMHHLPDDGIVRFLKWMDRVARRGWFVNDLHRSRIPFVTFKALAATMRWHRFVRHDGPVSFRRAFVPEDWRRYLRLAELPLDDVRIVARRPARLCVARVKGQ